MPVLFPRQLCPPLLICPLCCSPQVGKAKMAGTVLLLLFGLFAVTLTTYMTILSFVYPNDGPPC